MIQRIQSLYFLLTSLCSILFLKGSFLKFFNNSGSEILVDFKGVWQLTASGNPDLIQKQISLSIVIVLISVLPFITIFLYKNRRLQMKVTYAVITLTLVLVGILVFISAKVITEYQVNIVPDLKLMLAPLILIFSVLALRGIKRDENLVRSYDRLR
jgi:hypothetical protein